MAKKVCRCLKKKGGFAKGSVKVSGKCKKGQTKKCWMAGKKRRSTKKGKK